MKYVTLLLAMLLIGCRDSAGVDLIPDVSNPTPVKTVTQKKIYLYWYSASWCGPCKQDVPVVREWAESHKLTYTSDNDGNDAIHLVDVDKVQSTRNITVVPTYLIIDADGMELWRHEGRIDIEQLNTQWNR